MVMKTVLKFILFSFLFLAGSSCTVYTEKQTEALSQTIYASKDSLDAARIDLVDSYVSEATRIVKPPKQRIEIKAIYQKAKKDGSKDRVVVIPEKYKNDVVVVVTSKEYEELLKDKEAHDQLKKDNEKLNQAKKAVDEELIKQTVYNNKMVSDLKEMQKSLVERDLGILKRDVIIAILISTIGAGVYLRMKGVL